MPTSPSPIHESGRTNWGRFVMACVQEINQKCPGANPISTYPGHHPHVSRAADWMCSKEVGDKIAAYVANEATAKRLGIWYVIWYGRIWSMTRPEQGWIQYFDADATHPDGSPDRSRRHYNHVHISWYPPAGRIWRPPFTWWHVDPETVSTFLWGIKRGRNNIKAKPGRNIAVVRWKTTPDGRRFAVTAAGNQFDARFLKRGRYQR